MEGMRPGGLHKKYCVQSWVDKWLCLKSRNSPDDYDKFSLMPQRGNGLQPRVAASATLGKESDLVVNRNAVASALCISL